MHPTIPNRRRALQSLAAVAVATLAACGREDTTPVDCRLPSDGTVLAIGDSLTRGRGADGQGYVEQLQSLLAGSGSHAGVHVVNRGIDGERSAGLLARIDGELAAHRPALVLITSGGNDFLRRVAEHETRRNLQQVVDRVRQAGAVAVVFAIPTPSLTAFVGLLSEHPLYDELARTGQAHVIDDVVADVMTRGALKADRTHPNRAGYARMAQAAFEVLQRCR